MISGGAMLCWPHRVSDEEYHWFDKNERAETPRRNSLGEPPIH